MKVIATLVLALALGSAAQASVVTFKATVTNVQAADGTGSNQLLRQLGISVGGTVNLFFTIETNQAGGWSTYSSSLATYDYKTTTYDGFSMVTPRVAIRGEPSDGVTSDMSLINGISGQGLTADSISLQSRPGSASPYLYHQLSLLCDSYDLSLWNGSDPITAALLNSMSVKRFYMDKEINGVSMGISSSDITFSAVWQWNPNGGAQIAASAINPTGPVTVAPVPLAPTLPLEASALGLVGFVALRRRRRS